METERFQLPNGAYLSYAEYGAPGGKPLLLLHGLVGSVRPDGLKDRLQMFPLRVIALARPGYGDSNYFDMDCVADWGRHLIGFFEYLGIQRFDVLGISAGAPYAYSLAALYPNQVGTVYINSGMPAVCLPEVLAQYPSRDAALYNRFRSMSRQEVGTFLYESYLPALPKKVLQSQDFQDSMGEDLRNIGQEAKLQGIPWGFELSEVQCPVVLIHGTADSEVPYSAMQETSKYISNARIITLEGEEHASPTIEARLMEELLSG